MKFYESPETEIVKFSTMDVVVTSGEVVTDPTEDTNDPGDVGGDF